LYEILAKEKSTRSSMQLHLERKLYSATEMIKARGLIVERLQDDPRSLEIALYALDSADALNAATAEKNIALNKLREIAFGSGTENVPTLFPTDELAEIKDEAGNAPVVDTAEDQPPRKRRKKHQLNIISPVRTEKVCCIPIPQAKPAQTAQAASFTTTNLEPEKQSSRQVSLRLSLPNWKLCAAGVVNIPSRLPNQKLFNKAMQACTPRSSLCLPTFATAKE
jgi:hypothetical protein